MLRYVKIYVKMFLFSLLPIYLPKSFRFVKFHSKLGNIKIMTFPRVEINMSALVCMLQDLVKPSEM